MQHKALNAPIFRSAEPAAPLRTLFRRFLLWFCWLILFPLGCGLAVLSFTVEQTMSGRVLGIFLCDCQPPNGG